MGVMTFFILDQEKQHLQDRISHHGKFRKAVLHPPPVPGFLRPSKGKCFLVPEPAGLRHPAFQEQEFRAVFSSQISNPLAALGDPRFPWGPGMMGEPWFGPKLYIGVTIKKLVSWKYLKDRRLLEMNFRNLGH